MTLAHCPTKCQEAHAHVAGAPVPIGYRRDTDMDADMVLVECEFVDPGEYSRRCALIGAPAAPYWDLRVTIEARCGQYGAGRVKQALDEMLLIHRPAPKRRALAALVTCVTLSGSFEGLPAGWVAWDLPGHCENGFVCQFVDRLNLVPAAGALWIGRATDAMEREPVPGIGSASLVPCAH